MKLKNLTTAFLALFLAFVFVCNINAQANKRPLAGKTASQGSIPVSRVIQSMLKTTMADFTDSVENEDFSGLYASASEDFQETFKVEQLKEVFQVFLDKKTDVLPSLHSIPQTIAKITPAPSIRTEKGYKILMLAGKFPTRPYEVNFETEYELVDGEWKLLQIHVKM